MLGCGELSFCAVAAIRCAMKAIRSVQNRWRLTVGPQSGACTFVGHRTCGICTWADGYRSWRVRAGCRPPGVRRSRRSSPPGLTFSKRRPPCVLCGVAITDGLPALPGKTQDRIERGVEFASNAEVIDNLCHLRQIPHATERDFAFAFR